MGYHTGDRLYLVNQTMYVHIGMNMGKSAYTLYDKETQREISRGALEINSRRDQPLEEVFCDAQFRAFEQCDINKVSVEPVPLDILQKLKDAWLNPPLDEYPKPDCTYTMSDIARRGYLKGDLLPIFHDAAMNLFQQGFTIYEVDSSGKVSSSAEIDIARTHLSSILAISRTEWEASPAFRNTVADRMNHQSERELALFSHKGDCFAIYQLNRHDPDMRYIRYEPLEYLQNHGQRPQKDNYELVYTAPLPDGAGLNALWKKFNTDHPPDYQHPSIAISDVIAVKKNGTLTCYYVDQHSYAVLDDFFEQQSRQLDVAALPHKPSIKEQLTAKPIPGDKPATKPKDREVR